MNNVLNEQNKIALTFDVDWAPDFILDDVIGLLSKYSLSSTWFVTHPSPIWQTLRAQPGVELGIHPNFLDGSTQGDSVNDIASYLMKIVPQATCFRTHAMYQHGPLLSQLRQITGIAVDSSVFLPEQNNIAVVKHLTPHGVLYRLPIYWADDYELLKPDVSDLVIQQLCEPGLKILNFHPVHIYLNSPSFDFYETKKRLGLHQGMARYDGFGIRDIFVNLLRSFDSLDINPLTISEIGYAT